MGGKLTEAAIKAMQPGERPHKHADGGGLYIEVYPDGAKRWRHAYNIHGKRHVAGLGVWPRVSLRDARARHADARRLIAQGIDPVAARRAERRGPAPGADTFGHALAQWQEHKGKAWSPAHRRIVELVAGKYLAGFAPRPVEQITPQDMLALVRDIERAGFGDTARRVCAIASAVFNYARLLGAGIVINPADAIKAGLTPTAPARPMGYTTDPARLRAFMQACEQYQGSPATRAALTIAPFLLLRPGELRALVWEQVDLERAEIRLTLAQMKGAALAKQTRGGEVAHLVPLARQPLALFRQWREEQRGDATGGLVFAAKRGAGAEPLSNATFSAALRRMGEAAAGLTVHGWRHTASTLLHEAGFPSHVVEKQLAHRDQNRVRGIYNHAEYMRERRGMMQAWADYLEDIKQGRAGAALPKAPASGELDQAEPAPPEPLSIAEQIGLGKDGDAGLPDNLRAYLERRGQITGADHNEEGGGNVV